MILTKKFFERSAVVVARNLIGKFLVCLPRHRRGHGKEIVLMITETEAYHGTKDLASHAARGLTPRNRPMFGPPGRWYVYFTYGMHWMLNVVTGKSGYPSAVLIRSVIAPARRSFSGGGSPAIAGRGNLNGPAKLTKALYIDKKFNALPANRKTGLWIEDGGVCLKKSQIKTGPRIGVAYAGPIWSKKQYRFWI